MNRKKFKTYKFEADLKVEGYVECLPEDFQETVEHAIENGEFDYMMGSMDWREVEND